MLIEEVLGLMAIMFVSFFWGAVFTYALYENEIRIGILALQHPTAGGERDE